MGDGGGRKGQYIQLVSSTMPCYDLSPVPVPAYLAGGSDLEISDIEDLF